MIIIGAKGFSSEIIEDINLLDSSEEIAFFDDVTLNSPGRRFDKFPILKTTEALEAHFEKHSPKFTLGVGNPHIRYKLYKKFEALGGEFTGTMSPHSIIGKYDVSIGSGTNILAYAVISNTAKIGKGGIIYYHVSVTHDCVIGDFVEISPAATLLGNVKVGDFTHIGAGAIILPKVKIGKNAIIGAGAVVTKDVPDNCMVMGVPAKVVKVLESFAIKDE